MPSVDSFSVLSPDLRTLGRALPPAAYYNYSRAAGHPQRVSPRVHLR
jgi:hypothetical protein